MASQLAEAYVTVAMDSGKVPGQLAGLKSMMSNAIGDMASRFAMTGFVFNRLISAAKDFGMAIAEDEQEAIRFATAVERSGRGGAFTDMVDQLGQASEATTAFSADAIRAAATAVAPFRTLSNEMAGRVLEASKDISAQMGGDLASNARGLAFALERPEIGMRRLRAMGINLTAQQQEQIKTMLDLGNTSGAQAAIMDVVAAKTQGAAEKMGNTLMGLWTRIKTQIGEIVETMGGMMSDNLKAFGQFAIDVLTKFRALLESDSIVSRLAKTAAAFLGIAVSIGAVLPMLSTVKGLLFGTLGPIGWAAAAVAAIAARFLNLSDILKWFYETWTKVSNALTESRAWQTFVLAIEDIGSAIGDLLIDLFGLDRNWGLTFSRMGDWLAETAKDAVKMAADIVDAMTSIVEDMKPLFFTIRDFIVNVFATIRDMILGVMNDAKSAMNPGESFFNSWEEALNTFIAFAAMTRAVFEDLFAWVNNEWEIFKDQNSRTVQYWKDLFKNGWSAAGDAYSAAQATAEQRQRDREKRGFRTMEQLQDVGSAAANRFTEERRARERDRDARAAEKEFDDWWNGFIDEAVREPAGVEFEPEEGAKAGTSKMATGFVGLAEFAKAFQTGVLKDKTEDYQRRTADAAERTADSLEEGGFRETGGGVYFE